MVATGSAFIVTANGADVAEHPAALVTVTVKLAEAVTSIL